MRWICASTCNKTGVCRPDIVDKVSLYCGASLKHRSTLIDSTCIGNLTKNGVNFVILYEVVVTKEVNSVLSTIAYVVVAGYITAT